MLATDLRPRIGVENRLPEFIEEAMQLPQLPADLLQVLRRTSQAAVEHLADRFFRCMRREECDRIVDIVKELGTPAHGADPRNAAHWTAAPGSLGRGLA